MKFFFWFFTLFFLILSQSSDYDTSTVSKVYVDSGSVKLSCDVLMDSASNKLTVTMVGPSAVWYSVGFGNSVMSKTYSIIVDGEGNVEERYLIGTTSGISLADTFTVESNSVTDSVRTVVLSRDLNYNTPTHYHHSFSLDESTIETIYGYGTTSYLENHGEDQRGNEKLSMTRTKTSSKKNGNSHIIPINLQNRTTMIILAVSCVIAIGVILYVVHNYYKHRENGYTLLNSTKLDSTTASHEYGAIIPDENDRLVVV